jgi:phage tail-like protein
MKKVFLFIAFACLVSVCLPVRSQTSLIEKYYFRVTIQSMQFKFQEVAGLDMEAQPVESKKGSSPAFSTVKMPGIKKYGNVTLKKGAAPNTKIIADFLNSKSGSIKPSNITIELLDEKGKTEIAWTLANARPSKIVKSPSKAGDKELLVESIEIVHEGMTVKK